LFLIDINGFKWRPDCPHRSALETLLLLTKEIELYDKSILAKPAVLAISKMDTPQSSAKYEKFLLDLKLLIEGQTSHIDSEIIPDTILHFDDMIPISSRNTYNIMYLRKRFRSLIDYYYFEALQNETPRSFLSIIEREQNASFNEAMLI
jgi:GTP-binding protein, putative